MGELSRCKEHVLQKVQKPQTGEREICMKTSLAMTLLLSLLSCKTSQFKGGMAMTEAPMAKAEPEPIPTPDIIIPVETENSVLQTPAQNPPAKVETPRILTLSVSKLKHDSLYKNCLSVTVEGKNYAIACNKDFAAIPPRVITVSNSRSCHMLGITVESFKPADQADCIQRIQANRQQHNCEYLKEAFRVTRMPDALRLKATTIQQDGDKIHKLELAFEDSQDADFNDYTFSITAGEGSYLVNGEKGVEYCLR